MGARVIGVHATHNGNQEAVLRALERGNRNVSEIAHAAALDEIAVRNALRRLRDAGEVERADGHYRLVSKAWSAALADVWK